MVLISTTIGLIIPIVLMYREICQITGVRRKIILKRTILVSILTLVMFILVDSCNGLLDFVFSNQLTFLEFPICRLDCYNWYGLTELCVSILDFWIRLLSRKKQPASTIKIIIIFIINEQSNFYVKV